MTHRADELAYSLLELCPFLTPEDPRRQAIIEAAALLERLTKLEAVLEAAKAIDTIDCGECQYCNLIDAIRAATEGTPEVPEDPLEFGPPPRIRKEWET